MTVTPDRVREWLTAFLGGVLVGILLGGVLGARITYNWKLEQVVDYDFEKGKEVGYLDAFLDKAWHEHIPEQREEIEAKIKEVEKRFLND